jgi:hypothetical protein
MIDLSRGAVAHFTIADLRFIALSRVRSVP